MLVWGRLLFGAGALIAAYFLVEQADAVRWVRFGPALVVSGLGIILMRRAARGQAGSPETHRENLRLGAEALARLVDRIDRDRPDRPDDWPEWIDHGLMPELAVFVDVREALQAVAGLDGYARVMDAFARGERTLNRVWAAAADGYGGEAARSLALARDDFDAARRAMPTEGSV
jgi:hypothetical protein